VGTRAAAERAAAARDRLAQSNLEAVHASTAKYQAELKEKGTP